MSVPPASESHTTMPAAVLLFNIKEKGLLYATYMSLIDGGAIFVPTNKELKLGDDVFVQISLPEKEAGPDERYAIRGKVIWWTPPRALYKRVQGVGVQFPHGEKTGQLRARIEGILGAHLGSERETQTF